MIVTKKRSPYAARKEAVLFPVSKPTEETDGRAKPRPDTDA
uniref:Uncharacterized protein n=1 Tax=Candidatus Methanogaster sp. ANME-2c ERB4 TaxID=2759911 RepID=A0A7G9Y691_9EURY|nr:hypothetical protein HEBJAHIM_00007 [Methanosarcinales archaeon ANME-2c ERB4]QNO42120.1 hypothetical protein INBEEEIC_00022 [Methanosarcinales archaeon ANME-2c ERB4]QNO42278.1 hypothetical protein CCKMDOMK_00007 [Methanosarcinales archaeon ANME-2c ERB4]QNO42486.1 hypothetical protein LBOOMNCC_00039 [Methanosarcinales archaeon ANME-2c ERB4]QNO42571.1 hypothetical protein MMDHCPHC_00007 [Methanosarcinales archaeon ANME-2c ERB4]